MALSSTPNSSTTYTYTGDCQKVTLPATGLYKLEVYGAGGGGPGVDGQHQGAPGGYSVGYKVFNSGHTLYVCVGGAGKWQADGGYNGGGNAGIGGGGYIYGSGSGGGATHIANVSGTLASLGSTEHVHIVAGGGGGSENYNWRINWGFSDGQGGGEEGNGTAGPIEGAESGSVQSSDISSYCYATGGTQEHGGTSWANNGGSAGGAGSFGQGGNGSGPIGILHSSGNYAEYYSIGGGGGGGLYGGGGGAASAGEWYKTGDCPGGGGSGFIGNVPSITVGTQTYSPQTITGAGSTYETDGYAVITYIGSVALPIFYNNTQLTELYYNGIKIDSLVYNGKTLF